MTTQNIGDITSTAIGTGARYNAGKPPLDLIPLRILADVERGKLPSSALMPAAVLALAALARFQEGGGESDLLAALNYLTDGDLSECAHVFDYGRKKYAEWNWAKGMPWSVPIGCAARHIIAHLGGELLDAESGRKHLSGHAACNVVMLLHYVRAWREGDNRPPAIYFGEDILEPVRGPRHKDKALMLDAAKMLNDYGASLLDKDQPSDKAACYGPFSAEQCFLMKTALREAAREGEA